jgi:CubicO group peptidase (beta-lactamase class C family)
MNALRPGFYLLLMLIVSGSDRKLLSTCQANQPSDWLASVTSVFERETARSMQEYHVPGVAIAVVEDGEVVWRQQFGIVDKSKDGKVASTTLFEACSMSKPLFAYGVLQLVEQGKLDLDKPLVEYLEKPYMKGDDRHKRVTARMVLCHRTGFPNWRKGQLKNPTPPKLLYDPGSRFTYSGEGYTFLQVVVEKISGQPLDEFMRQNVLGPIGMKRSTYRWNDVTDVAAAAGHDGDGKLKTNKPRFKLPNAAFTLFTTPEEYALYLIEMMCEDCHASHSLSKVMRDDMLSRHSRGKSDGRWYGLGWAIIATDGGDEFYHGGANGTGFRCFSWFDPRHQRGVVVMANSIGGATLHAELMKVSGIIP